MLKLLMLFFMLIVPNISWCTTYYIDLAGTQGHVGNNSNNGTNPTTPWADCTPAEVPNFLQPGDIVNLAVGNTWSGTQAHCIIYSNGTITNPITVQAWGTGVDPIFDGSVDPTIDIVGWTGFSVYDNTNHIYVSNVSVPFDVNGISVDGTTGLARLRNGDQTLSGLNSLSNHFWLGGINQPIYIRLTDGSDPGTHTLKFNRYFFGSGSELVGTDTALGSFINFNHIQVIGSGEFGFQSYGQYVNLSNAVTRFNSREGVRFAEVGRANGFGAAYNTCTNCTVEYNASWGNTILIGGSGQGLTIESPNVTISSSLVDNNWTAGVDWLNYSLGVTNAINGKLINSVLYDNSLRSVNAADDFFDAIGLYTDCGSNIQVINNQFSSSTQHFKATGLINIGCEHPSLYPLIQNIDVVNNLLYGSTQYVGILLNPQGCSGNGCKIMSNIRIVGNTIALPVTNRSIYLNNAYPGGLGFFVFNNVIKNQAGSYIFFNFDNLTSDYNNYFSGSGFMDDGLQNFATWKTASGQDAHSTFATPLLVANGGGANNFYLSHIASGQGSDSPGVAGAVANYLGIQYKFLSIGTTRTDAVTDSGTPPDDGYHYNLVYTSSYFNSAQIGTTYQ